MVSWAKSMILRLWVWMNFGIGWTLVGQCLNQWGWTINKVDSCARVFYVRCNCMSSTEIDTAVLCSGNPWCMSMGVNELGASSNSLLQLHFPRTSVTSSPVCLMANRASAHHGVSWSRRPCTRLSNPVHELGQHASIIDEHVHGVGSLTKSGGEGNP